jgi:hypothetical protein
MHTVVNNPRMAQWRNMNLPPALQASIPDDEDEGTENDELSAFVELADERFFGNKEMVDDDKTVAASADYAAITRRRALIEERERVIKSLPRELRDQQREEWVADWSAPVNSQSYLTRVLNHYLLDAPTLTLAAEPMINIRILHESSGFGEIDNRSTEILRAHTQHLSVWGLKEESLSMNSLFGDNADSALFDGGSGGGGNGDSYIGSSSYLNDVLNGANPLLTSADPTIIPAGMRLSNLAHNSLGSPERNSSRGSVHRRRSMEMEEERERSEIEKKKAGHNMETFRDKLMRKVSSAELRKTSSSELDYSAAYDDRDSADTNHYLKSSTSGIALQDSDAGDSDDSSEDLAGGEMNEYAAAAKAKEDKKKRFLYDKAKKQSSFKIIDTDYSTALGTLRQTADITPKTPKLKEEIMSFYTVPDNERKTLASRLEIAKKNQQLANNKRVEDLKVTRIKSMMKAQQKGSVKDRATVRLR